MIVINHLNVNSCKHENKVVDFTSNYDAWYPTLVKSTA